MIPLPAHHQERLGRLYAGRPVCVTGGAGFIGGHLTERLTMLGAEVAVLDDLSNSTADHIATLIHRFAGRVHFIHGSILDPLSLNAAVAGAHTVFHLAALGSVPRSVEEPERTWSVNATGTLRVLDSARRAGASGFVLAASSAAYGDTPELPKVETMPPRPRSPYAASKLAAEHLVSAYAASYALPAVSLRYFNVFGPRQRADSAYAAVIPAFLACLRRGEPPVIYGDGRQSRDFTHVDNAVLATLLAGAGDKPIHGEVVNIGAGRRTDLLQLARALADRVGANGVKPDFRDPRPGDVRDSLAALDAARGLIGYEPFVDLEQGLDDTVAAASLAGSIGAAPARPPEGAAR